MIKSALLLCAVTTAFFTTAFLLPDTLNASPAVPAAAAQESASATTAVAGMAEQFQAEKARAVQQDLPPQF
jgi:hypothetical protein